MRQRPVIDILQSHSVMPATVHAVWSAGDKIKTVKIKMAQSGDENVDADRDGEELQLDSETGNPEAEAEL